MLPTTNETVTTRWTCEQCDRTGTVVLDSHAGVFEGLHAVEDAHHGAAPDCDAPTRRLRVSIEESS